jgi:hypothetical protein
MGVEAPVRSPLSFVLFPKVSIPLGDAKGEASIIIIAVEPTPYSLRFAAASGRG